MLSTFLVKIMAVIFDLNGIGRLGRERTLYQGGERQLKNTEWGKDGGVKKCLFAPSRPLPLPSTQTLNETWPVE